LISGTILSFAVVGVEFNAFLFIRKLHQQHIIFNPKSYGEKPLHLSGVTSNLNGWALPGIIHIFLLNFNRVEASYKAKKIFLNSLYSR